ncbi:MAG: S-layer homology domain-containing protein [Armatimonadota bacterium]|nr:S-layer homology domain-containing protein [Armatimonadota bacterium]
MRKQILIVSVATAALSTMTGACAAEKGSPFADVPKNHWAYQAVNKLAEAGIVEGYSLAPSKKEITINRQRTMAASNRRVRPAVKRNIRIHHSVSPVK